MIRQGKKTRRDNATHYKIMKDKIRQYKEIQSNTTQGYPMLTIQDKTMQAKTRQY